MLEQERITAAQEIQSLKEIISTRRAEQDRELRRRERLEKESKDLKHRSGTIEQQLKSRAALLTQSQANEARAEDALARQKNATDKAARELDACRARIAERELARDEQQERNQAASAELAARQTELKRKDEEINLARQEVQRQMKQKEQQIKKLKVAEDETVELKKVQEALKGQAAQLEREIDFEKKEQEQDRRAATEVKKELEELEKSLGKTHDLTQRQVDIVRLNATMIKQLEGEIGMYKAESMKQRKIVYHLEKERERFGAEASDANAKYVAALEEVKLREMTILDLQKKIAEGDARLKQQQNLYEAVSHLAPGPACAQSRYQPGSIPDRRSSPPTHPRPCPRQVRSDRNLYSKNLIESQDEIAEMKRKFKIMNHQIEQLKEEIEAKDQAFVKEHIEHSKADKEKDALKCGGRSKPAGPHLSPWPVVAGSQGPIAAAAS